MPVNEDRWIVKKLNRPGSKVERLYKLDELETKITEQWIRVTAKDGTQTSYRITEITRADPQNEPE